MTPGLAPIVGRTTTWVCRMLCIALSTRPTSRAPGDNLKTVTSHHPRASAPTLAIPSGYRHTHRYPLHFLALQLHGFLSSFIGSFAASSRFRSTSSSSSSSLSI